MVDEDVGEGEALGEDVGDTMGAGVVGAMVGSNGRPTTG
jgi:hypothetical protein